MQDKAMIRSQGSGSARRRIGNDRLTFANAGLALMLAAGAASAQNASWIGAPGETGNWTDPTKWDAPVPTGTATIQNGGIAVVDSSGIGCTAIFVHGTDGRSALRVNTGGGIAASGDFSLGGHNQTGMTGTLEVHGGSFTAGDLRVGYTGGNTGIVEMTEGVLSTGYIRVGVHVNRGGTVGGSGVGILRQSGGVINLTGTTISTLGGAAPGEQFGQVIMMGGSLTNNFILDIGASAGSYGELSISNATYVAKRNIRVGMSGSGRMEIHHGASVIMDNASALNVPLSLGNAVGAEGVVEMTGGHLSVMPLTISNGGTGVFRFKGGTIKMNDYRFHLIGAAGGSGLFEQSGGLLDLTTTGTIYLNNAAGSGRYNISGGTIDSISDISISNNPDVGAFRVTGSAPSIAIRRIVNANNAAFLLEFVLDKSPAHISRINMTSTSGYRTGHLKVGLDGGVLLTQNNTFTLLRGTMATTTDYNSRPDPNMWTETFEANVEGTIDESRITLASGYKMAELDMDGTKSATFAPRSMGHVTVANLDTSAMEEGLGVYLDVDTATYGKTPADLVNALVAAGYTNSTTEVEAPYDLVAVIPKAYVLDGASHFAWTFTDVSTGTTHATVSAVQLANWPVPVGIGGTLITIR